MLLCCCGSRVRAAASPIRRRGSFALRRSHMLHHRYAARMCDAAESSHLPSPSPHSPACDQLRAGPTRRRYLSGGERPPRRVVRPATPAGQPFSAARRPRPLEPLSEVSTHTTHPYKPRKRPPRPYRQIECRYDRSVTPSGCSAVLKTTTLTLRCPKASQSSSTHTRTTAKCAHRVPQSKSSVCGCPRARAAPEQLPARATVFATRARRGRNGARAPTRDQDTHTRPRQHFLHHCNPNAPSRGRAGDRATQPPESRRTTQRPAHRIDRPQATHHTPPWARAAR